MASHGVSGSVISRGTEMTTTDTINAMLIPTTTNTATATTAGAAASKKGKTTSASHPSNLDKGAIALAPFRNVWDACDRLFPFHTMYEEDVELCLDEKTPTPADGSKPEVKSEGEEQGGGPSSEKTAAADDPKLSYWFEWQEYLDKKASSVCDRIDDLEAKFNEIQRRLVRDESIDNCQAELMLKQDFATTLRKMQKIKQEQEHQGT